MTFMSSVCLFLLAVTAHNASVLVSAGGVQTCEAEVVKTCIYQYMQILEEEEQSHCSRVQVKKKRSKLHEINFQISCKQEDECSPLGLRGRSTGLVHFGTGITGIVQTSIAEFHFPGSHLVSVRGIRLKQRAVNKQMRRWRISCSKPIAYLGLCNRKKNIWKRTV